MTDTVQKPDTFGRLEEWRKGGMEDWKRVVSPPTLQPSIPPLLWRWEDFAWIQDIIGVQCLLDATHHI
jgi:hypothetical protein